MATGTRNTYWGSRLITTIGRNLLKAFIIKNRNFLSHGTPTYWHKTTPDFLNFFITNGITKYNCITEPNLDLSSNHTPVVASMSTMFANKPSQPRLTSISTDWTAFKSLCINNINLNLRIKSTEELDEAAQHFTQTVQRAACKSTSETNSKPETTTNVPLQIKRIVTQKCRSRRIWKNSRNVKEQHIYNRLRRQLQQP